MAFKNLSYSDTPSSTGELASYVIPSGKKIEIVHVSIDANTNTIAIDIRQSDDTLVNRLFLARENNTICMKKGFSYIGNNSDKLVIYCEDNQGTNANIDILFKEVTA